MRRREVVTLLGGAAAWPLAARGQQSDRVRRIGVLLPATADDAVFQTRMAAFLQALALLGWIVGRNLNIDIRWATANAAEIRRHATELAVLLPDVILATGDSTVPPLLQATRTVPIVFPVANDPVAAGYVDSLARPGGNVTGFMNFEYSFSGKWLELLKEIAPDVKRVAILRDTVANVTGLAQLGVIQAMASSLRVEVNPINLLDAGEIERAVAAFARMPNGGLILTASGAAIRHRDWSSRWRPGTSCPQSTGSASSSPLAVWPPMEPIWSTIIAARPLMSIAFSRARNQPTCRCRPRSSTSW